MIDLDADGLDPVTDLAGNILDGEWIDDVTTGPSGDGIAGGDFEFGFTVLPGDVDQSQLVTSYDYITTRVRHGQDTTGPNYSALHDIDGSGLIDSIDWMGIIGLLGTYAPAGQPTGATNDAPTTAGIPLVDIDDDTIDVAISLWNAFDDLEDADNELTYEITGNTDPTLLDVLSINSATGELIISAASGGSGGAGAMQAISGRTTVTVQSTDSNGLSVETDVTIDVNRDNLPPQIYDYWSEQAPGNTWLISGYVSDPDDDVEGFIVNFWGVFDIRATVDENGYFEFAVILDEDDYGFEFAQTQDPHGLQSNIPAVWVGLT